MIYHIQNKNMTMLYKLTSSIKKLTSKAFTLIELLIVIVIIGILAVALIPRLTWAQARARNTARMADLRQIQAALALYNADTGKYPNTSSSRRWNCVNFGSHPTSWLTWYVPGLAPEYISSLPLDPKSKRPGECYVYRSDGADYMILAYRTVEWSQSWIPNEMIRNYDAIATYAISTPWGKGR